jgi:hypothetical protein
MKKVVIIIFVFFLNPVFGQDWCEWNFAFKFKIDKEENGLDSVRYIKFYINDANFSMNYLSRDSSIKSVKYDTISKEYLLNLSYGCISCGFENAKEPPDIYIEVNVKAVALLKKETPSSTFIPIYIEKKDRKSKDDWSTKYHQAIDLGVIHLSDFICPERHSSLMFEAIELKKNNLILKRKAGEYKCKRMDKFVCLKVEIIGKK